MRKTKQPPTTAATIVVTGKPARPKEAALTKDETSQVTWNLQRTGMSSDI